MFLVFGVMSIIHALSRNFECYKTRDMWSADAALVSLKISFILLEIMFLFMLHRVSAF